jgi:hypothetical protein
MKRTIKSIIAAASAAFMCAAPVLTSVSSTPIVNSISASAAVYSNAYESFDNNWVPSISGVSNGVTKVNLGHVDYEFDRNTKTAKIVGMDKQDSCIKFPKGINVNGDFYATTAIGDNAFQNKDGKKLANGKAAPKGAALKKVDLSAAVNLKVIGNGAFDGCTQLTGSMKLSKTLKTIGNYAFRNTAITEISYTVEDRKPVSVLEKIGNEAFMNCKSLPKIYLPATVDTVGTKAFYNSGITLANFAGPNGKAITINNLAFANCSKLNSIGTDRIATGSCNNAFDNCASNANVHAYTSSLGTKGVESFTSTFTALKKK